VTDRSSPRGAVVALPGGRSSSRAGGSLTGPVSSG